MCYKTSRTSRVIAIYLRLTESTVTLSFYSSGSGAIWLIRFKIPGTSGLSSKFRGTLSAQVLIKWDDFAAQ